MVIKAAGRGRGKHMHTHRQTVGRCVGMPTYDEINATYVRVVGVYWNGAINAGTLTVVRGWGTVGAQDINI